MRRATEVLRGVISGVEENTDAELIRRFVAGDGEAFDALHLRHHPWVCRWLRGRGFGHADAVDIAQEAFVRVFRAADRFDASKGVFGSWLGAITRNCATRHAQRTGREHASALEDPAACLEDPDLSPDQQAARTEEHAAVDDCTERLPVQLRRIIRLRYARGETTRTIAATVGISEASVRNRLTEASDLLRQCLEAKGIL